ncbi:MAG: chromosome partitioning protein [Treponema sp.]|jgi:phage shock protein A|nr:chromosome partitioning protein [Treponema sp.]
MEKRPEDLSGMDTAAAREYIFNFLTTLKLTEQKIRELDGELATWHSRINVARTQGTGDLAAAAEQEAGRIVERQARLAEEAAELENQIEAMRKQIPALAARERSVDPDMLEQELLMAAGYLPGDEKKAETERRFREAEKNSAAGAALEELKEKMANGKRVD